jgi:hypothetical protein
VFIRECLCCRCLSLERFVAHVICRAAAAVGAAFGVCKAALFLGEELQVSFGKAGGRAASHGFRSRDYVAQQQSVEVKVSHLCKWGHVLPNVLGQVGAVSCRAIQQRKSHGFGL